MDIVGAAYGSFHGVVTALEEEFAALPKKPVRRKKA